MLAQYTSYKDKIADKLAVYENKTLGELKEIIKDYPDYTSEDLARLEKLKKEDEKIVNPLELSRSTEELHREYYKRACDWARDAALDDMFPEHDREHAIRAVACYLIVQYLNEKLA